MNKLILLTLLISLSCKAQSYKKFLNNSAWTIKVADLSGPGKDIWYYSSGDTTVGNYKYVRIKSTQYPSFLMREDTAQKKVYVLNQHGEFVLFNFNVSVGHLTGVFFMLDPTYTITCKVASIDTVMLADGPHRRFGFKEQRQYGINFSIIEGVGGESHPFFIFNMRGDPSYWLKCKFDGKVNIYHRDSTCDENLYYHSTSLQEVKTMPTVYAFPNPAYGKINIAADSEFRLEVTDAQGRVIQESENPNEVSLPKGIYFFRYIFKDSQSNGKVLIQ